ncbi:hypothetical protein TPHA_0K00440 [Tetrapisispora phaffii CBS 4417]|uniref:GPI transamidase component GPI17 n=1 Tax=Tetrapisispora phaffii (strain ATCC 24235 / CBS 4417 / NBRC 1672 / NRRL Y-8282 / UCD 70-5) TaxID=1071381 RepID=G8BZ50_TETPH|nr:hypothetical protein TPHA_0K00440 [Tetrapisispora phaffii CBS 4417]CCE65178.1 hypothetical protein TPHA_0K00440 [Tetrapisispora phaffii CBS 4417]
MSTYYSRKVSILTIIVLYLLVGVPAWYKLTSIFRVKLPVHYIQSLNDNKFQDVHMVLPIFIKSTIYKFPDIDKAVQTQINYLLDEQKQVIPWSLQVSQYDDELMESAKKHNSSYHVVELILDDAVGLVLSEDEDKTIIFFDDESVITNDLPYFIAQTVVEHAFKLENESLDKLVLFSRAIYSIPYSPKVHLNMFLLNGDGDPISWEIDSVLKTHFTPMRDFVSPIVNFTVDTSILYYNDLGLSSLANTSNSTSENIISKLDSLSITKLNDVRDYPTLNFAIVFPSKESFPGGVSFINTQTLDTSEKVSDVKKLHSHNRTSWESFLIPKWGSVIVNKYPIEKNGVLNEEFMVSVINAFSNNLLKLLGFPTALKATDNATISTFYNSLNSYKRIVTLSNMDKAVTTLHTLSTMLERFQNMPVPQEVQDDVIRSLELRLEIVDILNNPEIGDSLTWNKVLVMSNELVDLTEKAFFNQEMIQQNHVPREHKLAVYLPLLGPLTVMIIFSLMNNINEETSGEANKQDVGDEVSITDNSEIELIPEDKEDSSSTSINEDH